MTKHYMNHLVISRLSRSWQINGLALGAIFVFSLFFSSSVLAQSAKGKRDILQKTNVTRLQQMKVTFEKRQAELRKEAERVAKNRGWALKKVDAKGNFMELQRLDRNGNPMYYVTSGSAPLNLGGANTTNASALWTGGSLGLNLNGEGMIVGEWDGGAVRTSHQEFNNNANQDDGAVTLSDHATHVAGTMVAQGTDANAKGMASAATLSAHDWNSDETEMAAAAAGGLLMSNHSYGWNAFFLGIEQFGRYDDQAQEWDDIQFNAPFYLVIKAAGNDRGSFNTGKNGYDLVNGAAASKNTMVVAAVEETVNYTGPNSVVMSSFSSWGPTDDGRIKPDISAKGVSMFSSVASGDAAYSIFSGTSMASPNTTGSLTLVQQHYNNIHGNFMRASTLKALAIATAEETGDADGPDYEFGWGLLNVEKAVVAINDEGTSSVIDELTLNDGGSYSTTVNSDGTQPLTLTVAWTDVAGTPTADVLDDPTLMIVNDLDIRITKDGTTFNPWILDPSNPSAAATTGDNFRDNVERININGTTAGAYTITVTHKGTLSGGSQDFSLIVTGASAGDPPVCEATVPSGLNVNSIGETSATASWSAVALVASYDYRYRATGTTTWTDVNTTSTSANLTGLTASTEYEVQVRSNCTASSSAYSGSSTFTTADEPVPCTVTAPAGLSVSGVTSDAATASWDAVAEATTYNYRYRVAGTATWIDGSTSSTSATLSGLSSETDYEVQVNAECPDETSAYSGSANFTTEVASTLEPCNIAPQNIHTTSNTATSTTIGWNAVENVNFYQFRYKPTGTNGWTNGTVTVNELVLNGLTANTAYEMNIRSNCSTGNSPVTSFTWTTDGGGGSTCDVPSGLSAGSVSETGATISWSGASGANSYNYQYRASGTTTWTTANTGSTSATLSGLTASTSYDYQVESVCTGETSGYSSTAIFTTTDGGGGGETSCDIAPQNITASTTGSTANIDWSPVEGATTYQYRYRSTGAFTNGTTTTNSLSLTGLSANTTYTLHVRSYCGSFSPVATFSFTTSSGSSTNAFSTTAISTFTEGVTLYPNPAEGLLKVNIADIAGASVRIYDVKGVVVKSLKVNSNYTEIDIKNLERGMYIMKIVTDNASTQKRFVKK